MSTKQNRTAIILSGGKSSRMGEDKGLMLLNGKPMIQHVINVVTPLVDEVIIISNQSTYKKFGLKVYEDLIKDKGPLAGIYTGLFYSSSEKNIVLSCDTPYINSALISFLLDNSKGYDITIPENDKTTHQLIGVFSKSCIENFKNCLEKNQLKAITAFESLNLNVVNANHFDKNIFTNINAKSDIKN